MYDPLVEVVGTAWLALVGLATIARLALLAFDLRSRLLARRGALTPDALDLPIPLAGNIAP